MNCLGAKRGFNAVGIPNVSAQSGDPCSSFQQKLPCPEACLTPEISNNAGGGYGPSIAAGNGVAGFCGGAGTGGTKGAIAGTRVAAFSDGDVLGVAARSVPGLMISALQDRTRATKIIVPVANVRIMCLRSQYSLRRFHDLVSLQISFDEAPYTCVDQPWTIIAPSGRPRHRQSTAANLNPKLYSTQLANMRFVDLELRYR